MYDILRKNQNTYFSSAEDVLKWYSKSFALFKNESTGLWILKIDGLFKASFAEEEKEDAVLFFGNQRCHRNKTSEF